MVYKTENIFLKPSSRVEGCDIELTRVSKGWGVYRNPTNKRNWFVLHVPTSLRMGPYPKGRALDFAETLSAKLPEYTSPGNSSQEDSILVSLHSGI
jgi:hypothetical protein